MIELIGILELYQFMVTESIHFQILPRLSRLIWHESYTSLVKARIMEMRQCRVTVPSQTATQLLDRHGFLSSCNVVS